MKKPVSTDTIENLTKKAAQVGDFGSPPSVAEFQKKHNFDVPEGLGLAPVLYTRISRDENKAVYREFTKRVKPRFFMFLARHYRHDLRKLGICDYGIERMSKGLDPADKAGVLYDVSVDHIIERAGSGTYGLEKKTDRMMPKGSPSTYQVNHFRNLILMTDSVHDGLKNKINVQQQTSQIHDGQSVWVVMAVPKRTTRRHGFVHVVADQDKTKYGLRMRDQSLSQKISHMHHVLDQANALMREFRDMQMIKTATKTLETAAMLQKRHLNSVLEYQEKRRKLSQPRLARMFNDAVRYDQDAHEMYKKRVVPMFYEINERMAELRREVEADSKNQKAQASFNKLCKGEPLRFFKNAAAKVPVARIGSGRTILTEVKEDWFPQERKKRKPEHSETKRFNAGPK